MLTVSDPAANQLLAALPPAERERLFPHLEPVELGVGSVLYEPGEVIRHVYFPLDCIVSLLNVLATGAAAEIAVVGHDGLAGIESFMGGETSPSRAVVQNAGRALRVSVEKIRDEFHRNDMLHATFLRYTQALITQMAQTAVCIRHHSIDQQLCRWLLMWLDRLPSNHLTMTQEQISNMLGVRREGITNASGKLEKLGIVLHRRGKITILDRVLLEELCCECYAVVRRESNRLMQPARHP